MQPRHANLPFAERCEALLGLIDGTVVLQGTQGGNVSVCHACQLVRGQQRGGSCRAGGREVAAEGWVDGVGLVGGWEH